MANLSFGIKTAPWQTSYEAIREVWRAADAEPSIEHAWLFDHMNPIKSDVTGPCLEGEPRSRRLPPKPSAFVSD